MVKSKDVAQRIVILGAGYFAEEVADLILRTGIEDHDDEKPRNALALVSDYSMGGEAWSG